MTFKDKEKHPWSCDISRGDIQCPYVTLQITGGYLNCTWKVGHLTVGLPMKFATISQPHHLKENGY